MQTCLSVAFTPSLSIWELLASVPLELFLKQKTNWTYEFLICLQTTQIGHYSQANISFKIKKTLTFKQNTLP